MGKDILILPDSHSTPDYNNDRYLWFGKLMLDLKPDIVVNLGDYADLNSLCSYEYGKKQHEGKRYVKDVEAVLDADERLWSPIKTAKKKKPRAILTLGNHEERILRAVELDAKLEGVLSIEDLGYSNNWEVHDFKEVVEIEGVYFSHYMISGLLGKAISGEHPCYSLLSKRFVSCVVGHSHLRDFCQRTRADGQQIMAVSCGWYGDYKPEYAGNSAEMWWSGVTYLRDVENGAFDPEFINIARLKAAYG
jgi:hypothetical protein